MNEKDITIISHLRKDARIALTELSKKTQIPTSTIFDRLKQTEENFVIKHTTLIDFEKIGYTSKSMIMLKTTPEKRELLREYLSLHTNVNNLYVTNSNYDFMVETIFRNQKETQMFLEEVERNFNISEIKTCNLIDDVRREKFLSE